MGAKFRTEEGFSIAGVVDQLQGVANPNGSITAPKGSTYQETTNGRLYVNTDDATAWAEVGIAGAGSTEDPYQNAYTGKPNTGAATPDYTSTNVVADTDTLLDAISKLDSHAGNSVQTDDISVAGVTFVNDGSLTPASNTTLPTEKSVADYVASQIASEVSFKGGHTVDGTTETNISSAIVGDMYVIDDIVAGEFYGDTQVEVGDTIIRKTVTGDVSTDWVIIQSNMKDGSIVESFIATNAVTTDKVADDAVTYEKIQNVVSDNVILGNNSGADGVVDELTSAEVVTLLGLDGAYNKISNTMGVETKEVDAVATSLVVGVEWDVVIFETSTPANMYACKLFGACADGTQTNLDFTEYAVLEAGTPPGVTMTVVVNAGNIALSIVSTTAGLTYKITRRDIRK